jgi:hypothetical protein
MSTPSEFLAKFKQPCHVSIFNRQSNPVAVHLHDRVPVVGQGQEQPPGHPPNLIHHITIFTTNTLPTTTNTIPNLTHHITIFTTATLPTTNTFPYPPPFCSVAVGGSRVPLSHYPDLRPLPQLSSLQQHPKHRLLAQPKKSCPH